MRVLIASGAGGGTAKKSIGKYFHLQEFGYALEKLGVEYKLVRETEYVTGFPSKNVKGWFSKKKLHELIKEYNRHIAGGFKCCFINHSTDDRYGSGTSTTKTHNQNCLTV